MADKARVLLVDDHAVVRLGVRTLLQLEDDLEVVGEATSGREAVLEVKRLKPDLVLMDITLPDMSGLEAMEYIRESSTRPRVVVLTVHEDEDYFFRAIQAGAAGYVIKGGGSDQIVAALRAARDGGVYLYPPLAKSLVNDYMREQGSSVVESLSTRELEVLRLISDGLVNKDIASRLGIGVTTAQTYRTRIMEKLGLHTVAELTRYAVRKGIIRA